jgi:hypothetical protein
MSHDVFISYSSHDKAVADAVCATIENRKVRCWIAPRDVLPGQPYAESILDGIQKSRIFVLVFSSDSNLSQQVLREVERAVSKGIPVLPFRIDNVEPTKSMELFLSATHWLDALTPPLEKHLQKLADTVESLLGTQVPPKTEAELQGKLKSKRVTKNVFVKPLPIIAGIATVAVIISAIFLFHGGSGKGQYANQTSITTLANNIPALSTTPPTTGNLGQFGQTTSLPMQLMEHDSICINNRIYIIGGYNVTVKSNVYVSNINSDGTLGPWQETTALPQGREAFSLVACRGYLYVIGGNPDSSANIVLKAVVNTDGTLGNWTLVNSLPVYLEGSAAVSYNNVIYVIDGFIPGPSHPSQATVYYSSVNSDGSLNGWEQGNSNMYAREEPYAVALNGWIYLYGGYNNNVVDAQDYFPTAVEKAKINADGSISSWSTENNLNTARACLCGSIIDNTIYAIGGIPADGQPALSSVEFATINSDGTLSSWQLTSSLPNGVDWASASSSGNFIYVSRGWNGNSALSQVYFASISTKTSSNIVPNPPIEDEGLPQASIVKQ